MPFSFNGIGTTYYGKRDFRADGSYVTTEWFVFACLPIIPIRSVRVRHQGTGEQHWYLGIGSSERYAVYEQTSPHRKQVFYTYGYVALLLGWAFLVGYIALSLSPDAFESPNIWMVFIACIIPVPTPWILRQYAQKKKLHTCLRDFANLTDTLGWCLLIAMVVVVVYAVQKPKPPEPTIEVKVLSAYVNGKLYTKEAGPEDFARKYVVMPAADDTSDSVVLPWSAIKVSTHKTRVSELVDGLMRHNKIVEDLRARNDPLLPEALRMQSQLTRNLTPQEAEAVYQEVLRRDRLIKTPNQ